MARKEKEEADCHQEREEKGERWQLSGFRMKVGAEEGESKFTILSLIHRDGKKGTV